MATTGEQRIVLAGLRGRDGSTTSEGIEPELGGIPPNKAREMVNVEMWRAGFAAKRGGSDAVSLTCSGGTGPFSGHVRSTYRCRDGSLVALDSTGQFFLLNPGASQWVEFVVADAVSNPTTARARFAQGRENIVYVAYPNSANRLHWFSLGTNFMNRTGIGTPNAPSVADTGSGSTYAATPRYFRVRMSLGLGTAGRMGEASASTAFTPSGSGSAARISKPTTVDNASQWRVEVSLDDAVWYILSGWLDTSSVTTYDDSAAPTSYSTNDAAPLAGRFTNWTAVDYLVTDGNRLIGATTEGRVYFSAVRGTTDDTFLDEETVPTIENVQKNWINLDDDSSTLTGISAPFQSRIWCFRADSIAKLVPTHIDTSPYRVEWLIKDVYVGALNQESIVLGRDEGGSQALYWWSQLGPYRAGVSGLQYLGDDVLDLSENAKTKIGVEGTQPHGVYHGEKHQLWWWIPASSTSTEPDLTVKFHVRLGRPVLPGAIRDGWTTATGMPARCSTLYTSDGIASDSTDLVPYIGGVSSGSPYIRRCDSSSTTDAGANIQGYVTFPERHFIGMERTQRVVGAAVLGTVGDFNQHLTLTPDYGLSDALEFDADMTAEASETRKRAVFENALQDNFCSSVKVQVGDEFASDDTWTIDELILRVEPGTEIVP